MNVDLLISADGVPGILASAPFAGAPAACLFDPQGGILSIEYAAMDGGMEMNIPVIEDNRRALMRPPGRIEVGIIQDDEIEDAFQIPIVVLGNVFALRRQMPATGRTVSIDHFVYFMKRAVAGQPLNRVDMGDEASAQSILNDVAPSMMRLAPELALQRTLDIAPVTPGPNAPAPRGPGGMGASGTGVPARRIQKVPVQKTDGRPGESSQ